MFKNKVLCLITVILVCIISISAAAVVVEDEEIEKILNESPVQEDYPGADGVIIKSEVVYDFTYIPYRTQVNNIIKVFNRRGIDHFGEVNIRYDEMREDIELLEAYIVKSNGKIVEVTEEDIDKIIPDEISEGKRYAYIKDKIIKFPGLETDSVIVYSYLIKDRRPLMEDHFYLREKFAYIEPIEKISLSVRVNKGQKVQYNTVQGDIEVNIDESNYFSDKYTWIRENVTAVTRETTMPSLVDIVPVVKVSSFESWKEFSGWYTGLITNQYELNDEVLKKIEELTSGLFFKQEKIKALYNFVAQEIRYIEIEYGIGGYKPNTAVSVFENSYGNCQDKVTLLTAMLAGIGIDAETVLIGTEGHSNLEVPGPVDFNHMIIYLPEEDLYLDPTSDVIMYGNLPKDVQGKNVFLPVTNKIARTPIAPAEDNCESLIQNVKLSSDGSAEIGIEWEDTGVYDANYKSNFRQYNLEQRALVLEEILKAIYSSAVVKNYEINGVEGLNENFEINAELDVENYGQMIENDIVIEPFTFPLNLSSMVASEKRENPIFLGYNLNTYREINILMPDDYEISYLPQNFEINNNIGSLELSFSTIDDLLKIVLDVKTKKHIVNADEYHKLRHLFNSTGEITKQQILLEKNNK